MNRSESSELEQSYFLPTSAVSSSVVLRNSLLASNWSGEAKISQRKRVEVVHDALGRGQGFSHSSSLCQPCATETIDKLGKRTAELASEVRQYETARAAHLKKSRDNMSLEQIQQEIFLLTKEMSTFDESSLMSYVQCTSLQNEISKICIDNTAAIADTHRLDSEISGLDSEIMNTLELLDCTAREINHLRAIPFDSTSVIPKNRVAPLFDDIQCSSETDNDSIATINRCRLSYAANSRLNLNYSEINTAYVNLCVLLTCLRNACDLPSINLIGVGVSSTSPYFSLAYRSLLQQQLNDKMVKGNDLSLCANRFCRLLTLVQTSKNTNNLTSSRNGLILQLRPLQSKVLLRLLSPTGPTSAAEDWLHLEAGVTISFRRQTYSFKTSSKRNHKKVDWQGSGSCNSAGSAGSAGSIGASTAAPPPPPSSFFNNLLANSILFQSPASSPAPKQKNGVMSSNPTPTSPLPPAAYQQGAEEDQEAVVVESDQDDPVYRRAVVGLAVCVAVTTLDLLLARQGVTHSQLLSMSTVDSFRLLWSVASTHLKGCMLEIACALMTGVPVGFEEVLESMNETVMPGIEEFEVVEGHDRGSMTTAFAALEHSMVPKKIVPDRLKVSRQESLFDLKHTRVSEMHQLVMDMCITLKHVCNLE